MPFTVANCLHDFFSIKNSKSFCASHISSRRNVQFLEKSLNFYPFRPIYLSKSQLDEPWI